MKMIKYIECNCSCHEHSMRFVWFDEPDEKEMYMSVFLNQAGFWRRLWLGIKYIFGFKCKYGHFDEVLLTYPEIKQLYDLCEKWLIKHQSHMLP